VGTVRRALALAWIPSRGVAAFDACVVLTLLIAGVLLRLHWLPLTQLDENSVYPYTKALYLLSNWVWTPLPDISQLDKNWLWPPVLPRDAQFGPGLTWSHVPFVAGASSLDACIARRLMFQSTASPILYLALRVALWRLEPGARRSPGSPLAHWPSFIAALVAALAMGFTHLPFGILGPADDTYLAPELTAWGTAAAVMVLLARRRGFLLVALPLFAFTLMVHPFSVCYAVGCSVLLAAAWYRRQRLHLLVGLALAALAALPELIHVSSVATGNEGLVSTASSCDAEHRSFTWLVANGMATLRQLTPAGLGVALVGGLPVTLLGLGVMAAVGRSRAPAVQAWRERRSTSRAILLCTGWCVVNLLGLLAVGTVVGCLNPWHWSILLPSMSVQLGLGVYLLARGVLSVSSPTGPLGRHVVALLLSFAVVWQAAAAARTHWREAPYGYAHLEDCRWLARTIQADSGSAARWFEALTLDHSVRGYPWIYPPSLFIEQRLAMAIPPESFAAQGSLYLLVDGEPASTGKLVEAMGWDVDTARPRAQTGGEGKVLPSPQPAIGYPDVHLVAESWMVPGEHLLLLRIDGTEDALRWTQDLCMLFPSQRVGTHLDSVDYLSLTPGGGEAWGDVGAWIDPCTWI